MRLRPYPYLRGIVLIVVVTLGLGGCLVTRVLELRGQVCEFDTYFQLQLEESPELKLLEPVVLQTDLIAFIGAEPTGVRDTDQGQELLYVVEKVAEGEDPGHEFWVRFHFKRLERELRLARVSFDPGLYEFVDPAGLDPDILNETAATACDTNPAMAMSGIELDISPEVIAGLPDRNAILASVGRPSEQEEEGLLWVYEFRMKNTSGEQPTARVRVRFEPGGRLPVRVDARYWRYAGWMDFTARRMSMKFGI